MSRFRIKFSALTALDCLVPMFSWFGDGMSFLGHIFSIYIGVCFNKLDYVVVRKPTDEEDSLSNPETAADLEANHQAYGSVRESEAQESGKTETEKEEKETITEQPKSDDHLKIIGRTKEGIPIKLM